MSFDPNNINFKASHFVSGKFTEEDVQNYELMMDWETVYPELFGAKLPKEIIFKGFGLGENSTVDFTIQRFRDGKGIGSRSKLEKLPQFLLPLLFLVFLLYQLMVVSLLSERKFLLLLIENYNFYNLQ